MQAFAKTMMLPALLVAALAISGLSVAPGQDKKKDDKAAVIFEVYKDRSDEFRFRLKDGDHSLAIAGKGYKTKDDVLKVIDEIKKEAAKAKVVDDTAKK
jgi:uncharacterized protein YegP (UPF0339 family)